MTTRLSRLGPAAAGLVALGLAAAVAFDAQLQGWPRTVWFLGLLGLVGPMTAWLTGPCVAKGTPDRPQ